jgi:hypothetical protein
MKNRFLSRLNLPLAGICLALIIVTLSSFRKEEKLKLHFDTKKYTLTLGDTRIVKDMPMAAFEIKFGKPDNIKKRKNEEISSFYDIYGITISSVKGLIKGLTVTVNSDGDKNYTQKGFTGDFKFGTVNITQKTVKSDFKKLDGFFTCGLPSLCGSKNKKAEIRVLAGFQTEEPAKVTQISFIFN